METSKSIPEIGLLKPSLTFIVCKYVHSFRAASAGTKLSVLVLLCMNLIGMIPQKVTFNFRQGKIRMANF